MTDRKTRQVLRATARLRARRSKPDGLADRQLDGLLGLCLRHPALLVDLPAPASRGGSGPQSTSPAPPDAAPC